MCFLAVIVVLLCGSAGCGRREDKANLEGWEKKSSTVVTTQTYRDGEGNEIIYYCCKTTYHKEGIKPEDGKLDRQTLSAVIDWKKVEEEKECSVSQWPALLCLKDGRSYLCWTISTEYSCVIEYDAEAVEEEDIFRMAESVVRQ